MILRRLLCLSGLLLACSMGCCRSRCVSSDPCDPCAGDLNGGRHVSGRMHHRAGSRRMRNHGRNYGWNDVGCGCDLCSGGFDSELMGCGCSSGDCGGTSTFGSPSGCGCGQSHSSYAPGVPGAISPSAIPAAAPIPVPVPPAGIDPAPMPAPITGDANSMAFPNSLSMQTQQVSVEEFHRLPGVVVSGPTSQSAEPSLAISTSATLPVMVAPQLSSVPATPRIASGTQQVNWVPSK
jgi:hypothetical protein